MFPLAESGGLGAFGFRRFHTACIITRRVHQKQALFASAKIEHDTPRDGRGLKRRSGTGVLATYLNLFRNGWRAISKGTHELFQEDFARGDGVEQLLGHHDLFSKKSTGHLLARN